MAFDNVDYHRKLEGRECILKVVILKMTFAQQGGGILNRNSRKNIGMKIK